MVIPYLLLLSEKKFTKALKGLIWIIIALVLEKYALYYSFSGILATIALFFLIIVLRMLPGLAMGEYSLLTTSMSDLVASLKKLKFPDILIIPISVMFRFFLYRERRLSPGKRSHVFTWTSWKTTYSPTNADD